jgi:hypothetical protein
MNLKQRLIETYGRDFGQEAVLNRLVDFTEYLNHVCRGPIKRFLGILQFDKELFCNVYKKEFKTYGDKQMLYNEILGQKEVIQYIILM